MALFPIVEAVDRRRLRLKRGYGKQVEVDASQLKAAIEKSQPLVRNAQDLADLRQTLKAGGTPDSYPQLSVDAKGQIRVTDGGDLVALAAERGETIQVWVPDALSLNSLKRRFGTAARPPPPSIKSAVELPKAEIDQLTAFYKDAIQSITRRFLTAMASERPRLMSVLQQSIRTLEGLDQKADAWGNREVGTIYRTAKESVWRELSKLGVQQTTLAEALAFSLVDERSIRMLLYDPQVGLVASLRDATGEIEKRLRAIDSQSRFLQAHGDVVNADIANFGKLQGLPPDEVARRLMKDLLSGNPSSDMFYRQALVNRGQGDIYGNLAVIDRVRFPTQSGGIYDAPLSSYVNTVVRTKLAQAVGLARRSTLLENGRYLVRISTNMSLDDDACDLYIGRVFALTNQAAEATGVPHISRLPSGGCPFHPRCTHDEKPFYAEFMADDPGIEDMLTPPPAWALDREFSAVQRQFVKLGENAGKFNPNYAAAHTTGGRERKRKAEKAAR